MSEKISFIFPSRGRPDKFFKSLDNIIEFSVDDNYEVFAVIDVDDKTMDNEEVIDKILEYPNVKVFTGISKGKIDAINREIDKVQGKIIICMSDDFEFIVKGFDLRIREDMKDWEGVCHYPDGTPNGERLMTLQIMSIGYLKSQGYIYNPEYKSVYADDEETQKAKLLGKYKFVNQRLFTHKHWIFGLSEKDDLNAKNDSQEMYAHDRTVFERRKKINFGI